MKATQKLHDLGQSIWLDNITRDLLTSGTLKRYIDDLSVTGLTSNPTIFDHAIKNSASYDAAIRQKVGEGKSGEQLFFELALDDLGRAADLFRPIHRQTNNVQLGKHGRDRSNLWSYPGARSLSRTSDEGNLLAMHPTVKPVRLVADALPGQHRPGRHRPRRLSGKRHHSPCCRARRAGVPRAGDRPALCRHGDPPLAGAYRRGHRKRRHRLQL